MAEHVNRSLHVQRRIHSTPAAELDISRLHTTEQRIHRREADSGENHAERSDAEQRGRPRQLPDLVHSGEVRRRHASIRMCSHIHAQQSLRTAHLQDTQPSGLAISFHLSHRVRAQTSPVLFRPRAAQIRAPLRRLRSHLIADHFHL